MTWNSTMQRKTPLKARNPLKPKQSAKSRFGLAQRVAQSLGRAIQHARGESSVLRSETHRRNVAALPCVATGKPGPSQCAHVNFGKGMGLKSCDSLCFPLSPEAHRAHDQGGMPRQQRLRLEWEYADATRAELIRRNQWRPEVEAAYQKAIVPLGTMVHGDGTK